MRRFRKQKLKQIHKAMNSMKSMLFSTERNPLVGIRPAQTCGKLALLVALLLAVPAAIAESEKGIKSLQELQALSESTPIMEIPAKAAELIQSAEPEQRVQYGIRMVRVFLTERHSLAPSLVAAICRIAPEISVNVVSEAVKLFPEQSHRIVKAAVAAAPEFAARIALQATLDAPDQARPIRIALRSARSDASPLVGDLSTTLPFDRSESFESAIDTSKNRIEPGRRFPDAPLEVPEDFSGGEEDDFDYIGRLNYNQ